MDGPLEENSAMVGENSLPVMLRAGSILATGELLIINKDSEFY